MAENEAGVAEQEIGQEQEQEKEFEYPVKVEAAGPAAKKVTVEIPRDRITAKLEEQFKDVRRQAAIPGFRVGHAPRKLIEKRFKEEVKDQVRGALVQESYKQALEKNKLMVIGEPEFENPEGIKLPEEGSLSYSFSVEVAPDITMPDMANIKVKKPKITISEQNIDQAMANLREQQGVLVPVEDRGVEAGDYVVANVHVKVDGNVIAHQHDAQLVARPGRLGGIQVDDLGEQLAGAKGGDTRSINAKAADTHPNEQIRGKDVVIEVAILDIKKLELAEIDQAFLEDLGFEDQQGLRVALREQMEEKINDDIRQAMREQVNRYLLENTTLGVPAKLSVSQTQRVVERRAMDLLRRGIPREQIQANIETLRSGAAEEAARELKLFFILQKIANDSDVDVSEAELNGQVAILAAHSERRPEQLKREMEKDGSLSSLYVQLREQKAVDIILQKAQIEEVEMTPQEGQAAAAPASEVKADGAAESNNA